MKILILLCFFLAPFAILAQDWKDIPTPEAMSNTNDYEIAVDGSGDSYFIFSSYENGGIGLYVLKYEPFEQFWDTIYNYSFSYGYSQNLKTDFRGDDIFISLQMNQSSEIRYYVFSIINGQVNLEINPIATGIYEYENNYFTVGNNAGEYFWFAKKQDEPKYFISRYNSIDGTLISDTIPNSDAAYFSERRMSLVGDTLWIAYSTEQGEYHILKKHKTDENYYTFDNSLTGIFSQNDLGIQGYSVNWMSNRLNKLVFMGKNQMDEVFAYSFTNGILATDELPSLASFDQFDYVSSASNIYAAHTTFNQADYSYPMQVLKKDLSTGTWTQIGDDFSDINENYIRLGYSSTSDRLVCGSKYISEVSYDNTYNIRLLNTAPDPSSINFVQEPSICPGSTEANLTQTFELTDANFDSLNIISVVSSNESVIPTSSISFSTIAQSGNTTQFQLVGNTASSGASILTIEITDGYDTISVNKSITVLTVSAPTAFNQTFCGSEVVGNLVATGTDISWFSASDLTSLLPASTLLSTGTYYASQTISGCVSDLTSINVTVNALPNVQAGIDVTICNGQPVILSGSGATSYSWDLGVTNGVSFAPNSTAAYTVTGTDVNGCANTDQLIVTVKSLPNTQAGTDVTVCYGQPVTLTATGGVAFSWDLGVSNGISFIPTSTATYTVIGTSASGCTKTDQVVVTVNTLPNVQAGTDLTVCSGQSVTLSGSGASSYSWNLGAINGTSFVPSATTTYTVTGTDANGCTNTDQVIVNVNTLPNVQAGTDLTVCNGQSVTLSGSGASSYSWNLGVINGTSFVPTSTTTYTVTGTDANGCVNMDQVTVNVNALPNVQAGNDLTVCNGQSVTLSGSGASSYSWNLGVVNGTSFVPTSTTTYTVTGTDANGCTNTDQVIVNVNTLPNVQAGTDLTVCNGQSVTLSGSGASSYSWNLGVINGTSFVPTSTTTYTVTGTDVNGCINTDQVIVTVKALPNTQAGTDVTVCAGQSVTLNATGGVSFSWDLGVSNGISFIPSSTATYTVTGTNASGCTKTDQVVVTVNALPIVQAGTDLTVCNGQSVTLSGSGASSYSWNLGVVNGTSFVPTAAATYTVIGTDANGCTNTDQVIVNVNTLPNVQAGTDLTVCNGQSVTLSGSGALSYSWNLGVINGTSFVPTSTTTYTVTGTDVNGCTNADQVTVTVNSLPSVQAGTDITVCEGQSVTLSGSGADSYSWDLSVLDGISFIPTSTATYTVTGTDVNGCTNTDQVLVTVNALPNVQAGTDVTVCDGQSVTLSGLGASSYSWNLGVINGTSFAPTATTTYTVTGTDANGCSNTDQVIVTVNALPNVQAGTDVTICKLQSVTLAGSGANSYTWDLGVSNGVSFAPNSTATYTVTGTDINGCVNTDQVIVTVKALPNTQAGADVTVCAGQSVTLTATGGVTFSWDLGVSNGISFIPISTATYTVTGTNAAGCTKTDQVVVTVNALPIVQAGTDLTICDGQSVTLSGSGANSYSWDLGVTNGISFIPTATTTYTVTGTDLNGCVNTDQVIVTVNSLPNVQAGTDVTVCDGQSVTLSGSGASSYSWDLGVINGTSFIPTSTATYTVTGTDVNGCTNADQVTVTVNTLPSVQAGTDITVCEGQSVTLSGSGADSYSWDLSVLDGISFIPPSTATYTVTGTDANGCTNTDQVTVTVNTLPSVQAGTDVTVCSGQSVTLNGSGADSYSWDLSVLDGISFIPISTATYTVTGTDANGCINTDQLTVTVNTLPIVQAGTDVTVCDGQSVILTASGADTYSWDLGVTDGTSFIPTLTATYTVTGTDANGCINTDQVTVTVNTLPSVQAGADVTVCEGQSVTLNGSGADSYSWDLSVLDGTSFIPTSTATYTVTGTDANGCANTDQVAVTVNALPIVQAGTDVTVCDGQSVILTASGADTYSWDLGVTDGTSFIPTSTTTYTVTGTDANSCTNTDQVIVTVNALPIAQAGTDVTICASEAVTLNGSGSGSLSWSDNILNGELFYPAITANYTLTVVDLNGCSATDDVQVIVKNQPQINMVVTPTSCADSTGTATASISSGLAPYSYYWSDGSQNVLNIQNLPAGTFYCFVQDANGCQAIGTAVVQPPTITVTPTITPVTCYGGNNGSLLVDIQGLPAPYSIYWSSGHSTNSVVNLPSGTYEFTAVSQAGCVATGSYFISQPEALQTDITVIQPDCNVNNGSISITGTTGGTPTYSYAWSNGGSGNGQLNLAADIYSITTTDFAGCQTINTVYLSTIGSPNVLGQVTLPTCEASVGAIDVSINSITPYNVSWSTGATSEDISGLAAGSYTCTVTDNDGCVRVKGWNLKNIKPDVQEICLVTVDSVTTTNLIVWEKPVSSIISHYGIYRETSVIGEYILIDTVHYSNLSVFNDVVASPLARSWRYKIAAFNFCDDQSDLSNHHKTLHLNTFDQGGTSTLVTWDQYEGASYNAFDLWRFTNATGWELITTVGTGTLSYVDPIPLTTEGLDYMVEINFNNICTATVMKAQDFNKSRSNKEKGIFDPGAGDDKFSNNGIQETNLSNLNVKLYPNPTQGEFTVALTEQVQLTYEIISLTGTIHASGTLNELENVFQLDYLESGMYYLRLSSNTDSKHLPFIIKK
jgi:hypothetical protein